jgi:hypothetical protein
MQQALKDLTIQMSEFDPAAMSVCTCKKENSQEDKWDYFYKNIGTVAALGASITFALIISDLKDPRLVSRHGIFDLSAVRVIISVAWMLFMLVLTLPFGFAQRLRKAEKRKKYMYSMAFYILEVAAVICLALVVAAYVEVIGYISIAFVGYYMLLVIRRGLRVVKATKPVVDIKSTTPTLPDAMVTFTIDP